MGSVAGLDCRALNNIIRLFDGDCEESKKERGDMTICKSGSENSPPSLIYWLTNELTKTEEKEGLFSSCSPISFNSFNVFV